jgi:hypothetical protein
MTQCMLADSNFLRMPNRSNPGITDSFCTFCQTFVGASPRSSLLRLMEEAHSCPEIQSHRTRAAAKPKKKTSKGSTQ